MIHLALPPFLLGWSLECPVWVTGHMERHIIHIIHSFGVPFLLVFLESQGYSGKIRALKAFSWSEWFVCFFFCIEKKTVSLKEQSVSGFAIFGRWFWSKNLGQIRDGQANLPQLKKHDWAGLVLILMPTKWSWSCKARPARRARAC